MRNKKAPGERRGQRTREAVAVRKYGAFPGAGQGGLDPAGPFRHAGGPLTLRGVARAFPASQELEKVVSHIILQFKRLPHICAADCLHILAGCNVRMSVRLRRLRKGRGALYPAFFISLNFTRPTCFFFPFFL